jgi:hypothetical protein
MISTEAKVPTQEPAAPAIGTLTAPLIDIVVPVYNERATLERSIRRLHGFLEANMPPATKRGCPSAAAGGYCGAVTYRSERPSG